MKKERAEEIVLKNNNHNVKPFGVALVTGSDTIDSNSFIGNGMIFKAYDEDKTTYFYPFGEYIMIDGIVRTYLCVSDKLDIGEYIVVEKIASVAISD